MKPIKKKMKKFSREGREGDATFVPLRVTSRLKIGG